MFDLKKDKNNPGSETAGASGFNDDYKNVVAHTMQDDLDVLSGIDISPEEKVQRDRKNLIDREAAYNKNQEQKTGSSKSYSPFLNIPPSPPSGREENDSLPSPGKQEKRLKENTSGTRPDFNPSQRPKNGLRWNKILVISIIFIASLSLASGGYYFWITRKTQVVVPVPETINPEPEKPVVIEPVEEKFSLENPNYLSIDVESATPETIKQLLIKTGSEIKEEKITSPVEFIITDVNNNPVAFPIFSILSELELSPVTDSLNEKFSLILYPDENNIRLGLIIDLKDKPGASASIKIKEKTLVDGLSFLLLDAAIPKTGRSFTNGTHEDISIRYVNFDDENKGSLSIDYAFTENELILATSKNTAWAVLDKIGQNKNTE